MKLSSVRFWRGGGASDEKGGEKGRAREKESSTYIHTYIHRVERNENVKEWVRKKREWEEEYIYEQPGKPACTGVFDRPMNWIIASRVELERTGGPTESQLPACCYIYIYTYISTWLYGYTYMIWSLYIYSIPSKFHICVHDIFTTSSQYHYITWAFSICMYIYVCYVCMYGYICIYKYIE